MRNLVAGTLVVLSFAGAARAVGPTPPPPPANDSRDNAIDFPGIPGSVTGTTANATISFNEDGSSSCEGIGDTNSVWYRFVSDRDGRLVVAQHDNETTFDATLTIYRQNRSRFDFVDCDVTDDV